VAHRRLGTVAALATAGRGARILDATHFHLEYPNPLLLTVWLTAKRLFGFKWYKNVLDGSLPVRYRNFGRMQKWWFHRAVKAIDEFVVVSDELRAWLQDDLKVQQPITVIPCLLPPPESSATLPDRIAAEITKYESHAKRVCSIGVFFPAYGFNDVVEAVEELRTRTGRDIGVLLLDGGFIRDDTYRKTVLGKRDWITVLEGVPNQAVFQILKRSHAFVRATREEGFGISRIEALWSGIPVIATRAGETRGMLLYDFGDVEQLANQLQAVLLYPVFEEPNPWAKYFRHQAENNLTLIAQTLGIESPEPAQQRDDR
jgi:glycosyltransferase involved in cell wall biosynthesis